MENGTVSVVSRCPEQVIGSCHVRYRLTVPDNVPIMIETSSGTVDLAGVRASVADLHGVGRDQGHRLLRLLPARGLRQAGSVLDHLGVLGRPAGAALTHRGRARRRALRALHDRRAERHRATSARAGPSEDAPFQIQALSTRGDVTIAAAA